MTVTTDSTRSRSSSLQRLAARGGDDLGQPVMVAQVDEQHAAMVALAVNPARQADGRADVGGAKLGAVMGTVGVHDVALAAIADVRKFAGRRFACRIASLSTRGQARYGRRRLMKIHPLITKSDELAALVDRLAKQPFVAVDTEFMRENTYWPDLCLIQIASPEEAAAIDPKADIDLDALARRCWSTIMTC